MQTKPKIKSVSRTCWDKKPGRQFETHRIPANTTRGCFYQITHHFHPPFLMFSSRNKRRFSFCRLCLFFVFMLSSGLRGRRFVDRFLSSTTYRIIGKHYVCILLDRSVNVKNTHHTHTHTTQETLYTFSYRRLIFFDQTTNHKGYLESS